MMATAGRMDGLGWTDDPYQVWALTRDTRRCVHPVAVNGTVLDARIATPTTIRRILGPAGFTRRALHLPEHQIRAGYLDDPDDPVMIAATITELEAAKADGLTIHQYLHRDATSGRTELVPEGTPGPCTLTWPDGTRHHGHVVAWSAARPAGPGAFQLTQVATEMYQRHIGKGQFTREIPVVLVPTENRAIYGFWGVADMILTLPDIAAAYPNPAQAANARAYQDQVYTTAQTIAQLACQLATQATTLDRLVTAASDTAIVPMRDLYAQPVAGTGRSVAMLVAQAIADTPGAEHLDADRLADALTTARYHQAVTRPAATLPHWNPHG